MGSRFVCFWSHAEEYRKMAEACAASFAKFGVNVQIHEIPTRKSWMKNCMARASRLRDYAAVLDDEVLVLLDADLTCICDPVLLKSFSAQIGDIAVHDKGRAASRNTRYCPGIMAFAPTPLGRVCLSYWATLCEKDSTPNEMLREQAYLFKAIEEGRNNGLRVQALDNEYNCVAPVICHHVASRKLRDKVGGMM